MGVVDIELYPQSQSVSGGISGLQVGYRILSTPVIGGAFTGNLGAGWKVEIEGKTILGGKIATIDTLNRAFIIQFDLPGGDPAKPFEVAFKSIGNLVWSQNGDSHDFSIQFRQWDKTYDITYGAQRKGTSDRWIVAPPGFSRDDAFTQFEPGGAFGKGLPVPEFNLGFPAFQLPKIPNPFEAVGDWLGTVIIIGLAVLLVIIVLMVKR